MERGRMKGPGMTENKLNLKKREKEVEARENKEMEKGKEELNMREK